jgi:S-formylglutathione hydrolase FrmB
VRASAIRFFLGWLIFLGCLAALASNSSGSPPLNFEVAIRKGLTPEPEDGRLFIIISRTNSPEPRFTLTKTGPDAPLVIARDINGFASGINIGLDQHDLMASKAQRESRGTHTIQALFDSNRDMRSPNAPGNLYSKPEPFQFNSVRTGTVKLELTQQVPPDQLPPETSDLKFVKLQSKLLSRFHGRPIFLRAGIILPRDYEREASRQYALWVRIGGLNGHYTVVSRLMANDSEFRKTWLGENTPRLILVQLDGAGPYGDPYQINSANNGPYGDALIQELIPHIEARFRAIAQPRARVLSGTSTGGWVALALQVFYPDFFNGAWASCPDPVDFRALELVNIYQDENFYMNKNGYERPSARDSKGDITLTVRDEVGMEKRLGRGNDFLLSGEQWGEWNAAFGPRGANGLPVPLWDVESGAINRAVAEQWKKYDLRLVLEKNWKTLGPKLRGKIHIAAGEADQYFLNNAVHLLEESLSRADPPFEGKITYGPGKTHGWTNLSLRQMLGEMEASTDQKAR